MPIDLVVDDKEGGSRSDGEEFTRTPGGAEQASLHLYISILIDLFACFYGSSGIFLLGTYLMEIRLHQINVTLKI